MVKDYFRSLLTSFRGSHRSVPRLDFISGDPTVTHGYEARLDADHQFTAPSDGIYTVQAEHVKLVAIQRVVESVGLDWIFGWDGEGNGWPTAFVPCKKGDRLLFYTRDGNAGSTVTVHWRFYPNVGE